MYVPSKNVSKKVVEGKMDLSNFECLGSEEVTVLVVRVFASWKRGLLLYAT